MHWNFYGYKKNKLLAYLLKRLQVVKMNDLLCQTKISNFDVPQGTVLGSCLS